MAITLLQSNETTGGSESLFTSDIDNTYGLYIFKIIYVNPVTSGAFTWQVSEVNETGYDETFTTTVWQAYHQEDDATPVLQAQTGDDSDNGTGPVNFVSNLQNDADSSLSGELFLLNPGNISAAGTGTTKFFARVSQMGSMPGNADWHSGGYCNNAAAIDKVRFKMASGDMDSLISLYGVW